MSQPTTPRPSPLGALNQPVAPPSRRTLVRVAIVVAVIASLWGAWYWLNHPPRPWLVRWRVERFLKKQARTGDFKTAFVFPSKELMDKTPAKADTPTTPAQGAATGKSFDTLRDEYFALKSSALLLERNLERAATEQKETSAKLDELTRQIDAASGSDSATLQSNATILRERLAKLKQDAPSRAELAAKETALSPVVRDLWDFQRGWQAEGGSSGAASASAFAKARTDFTTSLREQFTKAGSYPDMYRLIGQELWVARQLLDARNPEVTRAGLSLALDAARHSLTDAQNGWVAARICEGYLWPRLDVADDTNRRSPFHPENFIRECAEIFERNNEFNNVVRTYETYLARAGTPKNKDWARAQLASAYEQAGDVKNAVHYLKQIEETNDYRGTLRRLPRLEAQLKK